MSVHSARELHDDEAWSRAPFEATITRVNGDGVFFRPIRGRGEGERARVAVLGYAAAAGDRVLVQRTSDASFVIGVIHAAGLVAASALATPSGARATVDGDTVAIHSVAGALIASYDGATGELRVCAEGDLRLSAPRGRAILEGAEGVVVGGGGASLTLEAGDAAIQGQAMKVEAGRVDVKASVTRWAVAEWELHADRVVERAKNVFRHVDGLLETRAKRLRALVASTLELRGRRTSMVSEKDTRIDGERVLLG